MSVKQNKEIVRRWNEEIINGRKTEAFGEVLDENYTLHTLNMQGIEETKRHFTELFKKFPNWRITIDDMVAEGDRVAVRMTFADNEKAVMEVMSFYRLAAGKIVEDWYCSSTTAQHQG
jgi:predicted SnoaL-like aldol condensation-catalyzing enzyme